MIIIIIYNEKKYLSIGRMLTNAVLRIIETVMALSRHLNQIRLVFVMLSYELPNGSKNTYDPIRLYLFSLDPPTI